MDEARVLVFEKEANTSKVDSRVIRTSTKHRKGLNVVKSQMTRRPRTFHSQIMILVHDTSPRLAAADSSQALERNIT